MRRHSRGRSAAAMCAARTLLFQSAGVGGGGGLVPAGFPAPARHSAWIAVVSGVLGAGRGCWSLAGVPPRGTRLAGFGAQQVDSRGMGCGRILDCAVPCGCWLVLGVLLPKGLCGDASPGGEADIGLCGAQTGVLALYVALGPIIHICTPILL